MSDLFLKIINMSISASWLVLAVLLLRFVLKKAPKWVNVLLWGIVAVRLAFPFSIESALSLIPSAETISPGIMMDNVPSVQTGVPAINSVINPVIGSSLAPAPGASANPLQIWIPILSIVWVIGVVALLLYTAVSYWRLRHKVSEAVILRDNIYQSENVASPFVLGVFGPRIYLPYNMDGQDLNHVVAHEQAHIRRKDHWWKPLGFLLLTLHWFNPLIWLAYVLLCRDIELACDEKVIKELGNEQRADYTQALVACSVNRRMIAACPLAFGEVGVKERVRSVMNYKKPAFWIIILAVIACVGVAVCFLTNPKQDSYTLRIVVPAGSQEEFVYSDEEVSTIKNSIKIWSGDGLGDTEVLLSPVNKATETGYTATYLTHGMPVEFDAEKDTWFKVGVNMQNPTDEDIFVYVEVENVEVRISDESTPDSITFEAEILEIYDGYFLVKPEASWTINSADQIEVPMEHMGASPEPEIGDIIEIAFDGEILETYPARIKEVYSIRVIRDISESTDILEIFQNNISDDETIIVTDYVYADDEVYGLDGIVQYADETGSPWKLAFIRDGVVHPVSQDWGTNYIIASDLNYLGNGIVQVYIEDTNDGAIYQCSMEYTYDSEENHTNFKATSNKVADRTLTQEEIDRVNDTFSPILFDKQGNPIGTNIWSCFFTSYYADIRDMNFAEFLAYFPGDGSVVDDAEFAVLKEQKDFLFYGEVSSLADMPVPVHRYPVRIINLMLKEYAGITVDDLDTSDVNYLSEYDAFYNYTSDAGHGMFTCTRGEIDGDIVRLYEEFDYGTDVLILKKVETGYHIVSHQQLNRN